MTPEPTKEAMEKAKEITLAARAKFRESLFRPVDFIEAKGVKEEG